MKNRVVLITPHSPFRPYLKETNQGLLYINPISPQIPLGVAYIASSLEEYNFNVKVVDLSYVNKNDYNTSEIKDIVLNLKPDYIGISALTSTISDTYNLAQIVKKENKKIPIFVGGAHSSALPYRTLKECSAIDGVIIGEGEYTFRNFLLSLNKKEKSANQLDLNGILYRKDDKIYGNPEPQYVSNLDSLPMPARHLFDMKRYAKFSIYLQAKKYPIETIITSRGCPYSCEYCSKATSGNIFRYRSPKNVLKELEQLKEYGFNEIQIKDDVFCLNKKRVYEICRLIKENSLDMSFNLSNGVRVDSIDEALLEKMYDVGFYSIYFGVESGDDEILKNIGKNITVKQIKHAIKIAKNIGFNVTLFTIIGLPGSSVSSEEKTLDLIKESGADSAVTSICTPYPGSLLWEKVKNQIGDVSWDRYKESDVSNPIYIPKNMTIEEIQMVIKKFEKIPNIEIG